MVMMWHGCAEFWRERAGGEETKEGEKGEEGEAQEGQGQGRRTRRLMAVEGGLGVHFVLGGERLRTHMALQAQSSICQAKTPAGSHG
jgi:hypothetical protein